MEWLDFARNDPGWLVGLLLVVAFQGWLHLISLRRQRRELGNQVRNLERRLKESRESEWGAIHAKIRSFCEEQQSMVDQMRAGLAEAELRRRVGSPAQNWSPAARLDRRHQVLALAQMGFDSREIARKLRLSRGETELLLGISGTLSEAGQFNG